MSSLALGTVIYTAVKPIFKIYFIIACGFVLGKKNILTVETARNVSDMIISLILPCLIFTNIVTNLQNSDIKQIGIICFVAFLFTLIGFLGGIAAYLVSKPQYWLGGCLSVALMPNISDLPIAYLQTFASGMVFTEDEGDKGVAYICIFTAFQVFFQFNLGLFKLIGYDFDVQRKAEAEDDEKLVHCDEDLVNHDTVGTSSSREKSVTMKDSNDNGDDNQGDNNEEDEDTNSTNTDAMELQQWGVVPLTSPHSTSIERTQSRISNISLRRLRSQSLHELINEYSQAESIKNGSMHPHPAPLTDLELVPTHDGNIQSNSNVKSKLIQFAKFTLDNFKKPISIALVLALIVSMIPWVKALFVTSDQVTLPDAPDQLPPLSFLMDFTSYLADACVPLGLLILGATLSRLSIKSMTLKFLYAPALLSLVRLVILPILGAAIISGLAKIGWFDDDDMLRFVCTIVWGLPNATSLIYLTAFYTPLEGEWKQMDYLAVTYILEYPFLSISLPFLTTYTIKVGLGY